MPYSKSRPTGSGPGVDAGADGGPATAFAATKRAARRNGIFMRRSFLRFRGLGDRRHDDEDLVAKMRQYNIDFTELNKNDTLFGYLV